MLLKWLRNRPHSCSLKKIALRGYEAKTASGFKKASTNSMKARLQTTQTVMLGIVVASLLSANRARADGAGDESSSASISTLSAPTSNFRGKSQFDELTFTAGQESYLTKEALVKAGTSTYTQLSAHMKARTESHPLSGALEIGGSFATDVENYTNIEIPEAYLNWESTMLKTSRARVVLGRKKERWSGLDQDWALGLVEPLNKFDALRPSEQGLTGAFIGWGHGGFDVIAFGSTLYIPEQGAPFQLQNGQFSSNSPWFSAPPSKLVLLSQERPVNYSLDTPSIGSVINHPSAGLMIRASDPTGPHFYAQAAFLHKPRNSLSLPFSGKLRLENTTNYGDVTVFPEVVYHNLTMADIGYENQTVAASFSALSEISDTPEVTPDLTYQQINPLYILSPSFEVRTFASHFWGPRFKLSYLDSWGGDSQTLGQNASNGNVFGPTVPYSRATSVAVNSVLFRKGRYEVEQGFRWIEELSEQGTVLMGDLRFRFGDAWRLTLSGDLLGSRQDPSKTDTFIARYRGNDRVAARATYIF